MNSQKGFLSPWQGFARCVMAAAAVAVIVTMASFVLSAEPALAALAAGNSAVQRVAPASSPAVKVKYFVVPRPRKGSAQTLSQIAARTLGDGSRYPQIFALNKGRLQPGGGRLENPRVIEPGWILRLPASASGPGVHFGPLPAVTAPAAGRPARSRTAGPPPSSPHSTAAKPRPSASLAGQFLLLGVLLIVVMAAVWFFSPGRRRGTTRRPSTRQPSTRQPSRPRFSWQNTSRGSHARGPRLKTGPVPGPVAGDQWMGGPDLYRDQPDPATAQGEYPVWPGGPSRYALHPDHPSWPGRPDPSWPEPWLAGP